jgi:antitoxin MazE
MKARLIRIGNSRGLRLPKPLIEQAGLENEVELCVHDGVIEISSSKSPRTGWAAAAERLRQCDQDRLLDPGTPTRFDEEEWQW